MDTLIFIALIVLVYVVVVFVGIRLFVPYMGFGRFRLPESLSQEVLQTIRELENKSIDGQAYLAAAYNFVATRWHAGRMNVIFKAPLAFRTNLQKLWNSPGFAHCNTQNYILFLLLAGSKFFTEEDVQPRCVMFNFFIHQYLRVRVADRWVDADPAGASIRGKPLGEHIEWFG
jgi:hypothetical protein